MSAPKGLPHAMLRMGLVTGPEYVMSAPGVHESQAWA